MRRLVLLCLVVLCSCAAVVFSDTKVQQVAIALTGSPTEMSITWATTDETDTSTVVYGQNPNQLTMTEKGTSYHYYLPLYTSPAFHNVILKDLKQGTRYFYKCGDDKGGWSDVYYFDTEPASPPTPANPLNIAILADEGATEYSQQVFNAIMKADAKLHFSFSMLSGDLSYANGDQPVWDTWQNMIQPLASHAAFMVAPGNHEAISLFIPYENRLRMPQNGYGNLYYSFNYQNVHFLVLNSESINEFHWSAMYQFAEADLTAVDRARTPWVFAAWHHPWYCSNVAHNDSAWFMKEEYEKLFYDQKVDMVFQGHVHAYERTHPVYNWKVDSKAPVFMTDGHAGNKEGLYKNWQNPQPSWSAFRISEYGFSTLQIFNSSHIHWQMIRSNDSSVADDWWFIREH